MDYRFEVAKRKEYAIIRDYYVSNDHLQGIYFLLYDEETKELVTKFLKKELVNNDFNWKRKGLLKQSFYTIGVERGKENRVLLETGTLITTKRNSSGEVNIKRNKAEKIIFSLKL